MSLPTVPLLHRQLKTTLQLLILLLSMMSTNDIILVSVCLTEANIIMGQTLAERDNTATNGTLIST